MDNTVEITIDLLHIISFSPSVFISIKVIEPTGMAISYTNTWLTILSNGSPLTIRAQIIGITRSLIMENT